MSEAVAEGAAGRTAEEVPAELEAVENEITRTEQELAAMRAAGETSAKALDAFGRARNRLDLLKARAGTLRDAMLEVEAGRLDAAADEAREKCRRLAEKANEARAAAEPKLMEEFAVYPQTEVAIKDLVEAYKPVHDLVLEQRAAQRLLTVAAKRASGFRRENELH